MDLYKCVYISKPARLGVTERDDDLKQIMTVAVQNNARLGITGVLLNTEQFYIQCLEGERQIISDLLCKLFRDIRHVEMTLIEFVPIDALVLSLEHDAHHHQGRRGGADPKILGRCAF